MIDVDHLERTAFLVVVDMAMFGIHGEEQHAEAAEAINAETGAVELAFVAEDLVEYISSAPFIKQEFPLSAHCCVILFRQEGEEYSLFIISDALCHHCLEQGGDVVVVQVAALRVGNDELNEAHEAIYVLFVRDIVTEEFQLFLATSSIDLLISNLCLCDFPLVKGSIGYHLRENVLF